MTVLHRREDGRWTLVSAYGLAVLTLILALNYADRQILGLVLPLIKREMHLSDLSLGLITGFVFVLFYSILGVPIGRLADRRSRRNILGIGLAFWSLMTFLSGFVVNIWQLAAARFLMGAGEATVIAPSLSIVADMFDRARRPLAIAILASGSSLSALLFFPAIGWLAQNYGWRVCFIVSGAFGIAAAALLFLTVPEPLRAGTRDGEETIQESVGATVRFLLGSRAYIMILLGGAFMGISVYAAQVWFPTFLVRVHHLNMLQIGYSIGLVRGVAGLTGTIAGGLVTAWLAQFDDRWRLWIPGFACMLILPAQLLFLLSPSLPIALGGMLLGEFFFAVQIGPIYAACQVVARPAMRATATATFLFFANVFGQVIGPLTVGYLNDRWAAAYGPEAIRFSLIFGSACALLGGLFLVVGARSLTRDLARAEA